MNGQFQFLCHLQYSVLIQYKISTDWWQIVFFSDIRLFHDFFNWKIYTLSVGTCTTPTLVVLCMSLGSHFIFTFKTSCQGTNILTCQYLCFFWKILCYTNFGRFDICAVHPMVTQKRIPNFSTNQKKFGILLDYVVICKFS